LKVQTASSLLIGHTPLSQIAYNILHKKETGRDRLLPVTSRYASAISAWAGG